MKLGLSASAVRRVLEKGRNIPTKERRSTNVRRELRSALLQLEMIPLCLKLDSPTRWGSTIAMRKRYLKVHAAVQGALESYYTYTDAGSSGKVQQPTSSELRLLENVVDTLTVEETLSAGLGAEGSVTAYMKWEDAGHCRNLSRIPQMTLMTFNTSNVCWR